MSAPTMAFFAGLGAGHLDEVDKQRRNARQDKLDAQQDEQYQFQRSERERAIADRAALRAAAAEVPVVAEGGLPATMDNRDVGLPGEAPVAAPSFRVGASTFASQGVAAEAAAGQRQKNIATALDTQDPAGAGGRELQTLNLTAAKRAAANQRWDEDLASAFASANPVEGAVKFMGDSHGDGMGGAFKAKPEYSADGKHFRILKLSDDGTAAPGGMPWLTNDQQGWGQLQLAMSKGIPLQNKLAHYQQVTEAERRAKHDEASLAIQKQNADSMERSRADAARHASVQEGFESRRLSMESARFGLAKAAADAENKLPPAVKQQFASYDKELNTIGSAIAKAQAEGSFDQASPSAQQLLLRQRELMAKSERLLTPYMGGRGGDADPLGLYMKPPPSGSPAATIRNAPPGGVKLADGKWIPTTAASIAQGGVQPPDSQQGIALDAARSVVAAAREKLLSYGSIQRQRDPQGFAGAQAALAQAQEAERAAAAVYAQSAQASSGASFRVANP